MNDITAEKFAVLLAICAKTGIATELRKEAAAQNLLKESMTAQDKLLWALGGGALGAGLGGAAGYLGNSDEKKKKRDAIYGALSGGLLGLGIPLIGSGWDTAAQSAKNMNAANDKLTDTKKEIEGTVDATDAAREPTTADQLFGPGGAYRKLNPGGMGRAIATGGLGTLGFAAGAAADSSTARRAYNRAQRQTLYDTVVPPRPAPGAKPQNIPLWQERARQILTGIGNANAQQAPAGDLVTRLTDTLRRVPRAATGPRAEAARAVGLGNLSDTRQWLASFLPEAVRGRLPNVVLDPGQKGQIADWHARRQEARAIQRAATQEAVPSVNAGKATGTLNRAISRLVQISNREAQVAAARQAGAEAIRRGATPAQIQRAEQKAWAAAEARVTPADVGALSAAAGAGPVPSKRRAPPNNGKTPWRGKLRGAGAAGTIGTILSHPNIAERIVNFFNTRDAAPKSQETP